MPGKKNVSDGLDVNFWEEKYRIADAKLMELEGELDVLLHCAEVLRKQRTKLTQDQSPWKDSSSDEKIILEKTTRFVDDYLALGNKCAALEEKVEALKERCAESRAECVYIRDKIRLLSPRQKGVGLHTKDTLAYGVPESGFRDPIAVAERILSAESSAISLGAVVGAFGAGITYTTIFSATRGRLDLICWAFTCFLLVIVSCGAFQVFSPPRHRQILRILGMEYVGSAEHKLLSFTLLVGLPMLAGFLLLALSVVFLDVNAQEPTPGSQLAVQAAGYLPIAFLGYFVIVVVLIALVTTAIRVLYRFRVLHWPSMDYLPLEARKDYPSILFKVKDRLQFLPGGKGYPKYREQRLGKIGKKESA